MHHCNCNPFIVVRPYIIEFYAIWVTVMFVFFVSLFLKSEIKAPHKWHLIYRYILFFILILIVIAAIGEQSPTPIKSIMMEIVIPVDSAISVSWCQTFMRPANVLQVSVWSLSSARTRVVWRDWHLFRTLMVTGSRFSIQLMLFEKFVIIENVHFLLKKRKKKIYLNERPRSHKLFVGKTFIVYSCKCSN